MPASSDEDDVGPQLPPGGADSDSEPDVGPAPPPPDGADGKGGDADEEEEADIGPVPPPKAKKRKVRPAETTSYASESLESKRDRSGGGRTGAKATD